MIDALLHALLRAPVGHNISSLVLAANFSACPLSLMNLVRDDSGTHHPPPGPLTTAKSYHWSV